VDVDAVQQWAADFLLVAGDGHGGTTVFFDGIALEAAGAGMRVAVVGAI
jgi:ATP:corrinoid adenosyltransferase